ncbi:ankyrin repeat protein [Diaporthe helianthi]|uniref:Ankyrin repeat protein n=1 Tax=Diaporthe helianthi TaxID=158607 RepID=A0A2P5IAR8_DIAHE|nr:ankyrin repeat protein [Diaporthe helianthi]
MRSWDPTQPEHRPDVIGIEQAEFDHEKKKKIIIVFMLSLVITSAAQNLNPTPYCGLAELRLPSFPSFQCPVPRQKSESRLYIACHSDRIRRPDWAVTLSVGSGSTVRRRAATMSFGFSVGDFLTVINLATQIRKQFSDAPKHFRDLSDEVRSLSVTLFDLAGEDDGVLGGLGLNEAEHLRSILEASHHVLKDLEKILESTGKGGTLLCPGIPGAGKTYTSAMVIEKLHSLLRSGNDDFGVAYFFCNYKEYDHDEVSVAKSLLSMLLAQLRHLPNAVKKAYQIHRQCGTELSDPDEVFDALMTSLSSNSSNFLVIDALDELQASARRPLISRLVEIQQKTAVSLFVTSRDLGNFEDLFPGATRITIQATDHDIQQYLSTHMRSLPLCVRKDPALQNEVKIAIVQAAGEMFLLADLHLRSLMNVRPSQKAVREALKGLKTGPSATADAFEKAMRRINDQPKETSLMAMRTLLLLTYARRPLTVDELCHALAVEADDQDGEFDPHNVPEMEDVLPSCAGLVVVQSRHQAVGSTAASLGTHSYLQYDPEDRTSTSPHELVHEYANNAVVQLVHKSFQDYLSLTKSEWFPRAESIMATICRAYMSACEGLESPTDRPFLEYAKSRWGYHHLKAEADSATPETDCDPEVTHGQARNNSLSADKQSLSMQFGIRQLSKELGGMQELLFWACKEGRHNLVEVLLTTNLDVYTQQLDQSPRDPGNFPDEDGEDGTPATQPTGARLIDYALSYSVSKSGNQAVIECLVAHGASLGRRLQFPKEHEGETFIGRTALDHSVGSTVKQAIFPCLASRSSILIWDTTPLIAAVYHDQDSCLDIILDWMRSQGHQASDETWLQPLKRAMLLGLQQRSLKTLVKVSQIIGIHDELAGMDTGPNQEQINVRHIGIALNSKYPLRTLLANEGVVIPQPDPCGAYAICIATASSYTDVVQTLLSSNVEIQPQLLVDSLFRGNTNDVALIAHRLCERICGDESLNRFDILHEILFGALHQHMLLHDKHWKRSEHYKSRSDDLANIDAFDLIWDTSVLDLQRSRLEWDFMDVILQDANNPITSSSSPTGASLNAAPGTASSPNLQTLFLAIGLRDRELVDKLIQYDPSLVHQTDAKGRTALMAAVCTRCEALTSLLIESLDEASAASTINAVSETGYSAIAYAVRAHHVGQVECLLENPGLDAWSVFHEVVGGGSPFVWALDMMPDNDICEYISRSLMNHPNRERLSHATQQLHRLPKRIYLGEDRERGCLDSWKPLLCYAVIHRHLWTFKFLLETEVDLEAPDGRGRTALSHAEESIMDCDISRDMVEILLAHGADILKLDHARRFPLWYALDSQQASIAAYDDVSDNPHEPHMGDEQLISLWLHRPRFLSEVEGVGNTLFDLALTRCALNVLKFLANFSREGILLEYAATSVLTPLAKMTLSFGVTVPIGGSEDNPHPRSYAACALSRVKALYACLNSLKISQDTPDQDGKTALCHALDRLYAEYCDTSPHISLQEFQSSEALTCALLFLIEELIDRDDSNPLRRNLEGYCALDVAHALLDHFKQEQRRKPDQGPDGANPSSSSAVPPNLNPPSDDFSKDLEQAGGPPDTSHMTVETALEALDGAIDLLDAPDAEDSFESSSFDAKGENEMEAAEYDESTIIGGRRKMKAIMGQVKSEWLRKHAAEATRLGAISFWDEDKASVGNRASGT